MNLPIELGWPVAANTGWGLYGLHLALGLARQGRNVYIPPSDLSGIPATLRPSLMAMMEHGNPDEERIRFDTWGNHAPPWVDIPNRIRVLLAVFEDSAAVDAEIMQRYDLVLAPSRWVQSLLAAKGIKSTVFHQGYDDSLFTPAQKRRPTDGRVYVFSGGKLEFRKGQDIVVEAFRRFRATPDGKDAILVTAWQNLWPQTMGGIWESGYVKGIPAMRGPQLDISGWLEVNGIPREAHIDLGLLSQAEMANAIRECDVGLFPNRAEGATNMALVEALGGGLPCVASQNTGQRDVSSPMVLPLTCQSPMTLPCRLYRSVDGWGESDPDECVAKMIDAIEYRGCGNDRFGNEWGWGVRTADLHDILFKAHFGGRP
jgi:glycosyltransferase involved in cell wall biosynthesis